MNLLDDDGLLDLGGKQPEPVEGCHLCGRKAAHNCTGCAKTTCQEHMWVMLGLCRSCATEKRMRRWKQRGVQEENWLEEE